MMKKLLLAVTVAAFSFGVMAGENCADKAKSGCPAAKEAGKCPAGGDAKKAEAKKPAESPKGAQAKK